MICKICKKAYQYDYSVTDEDWEIVTGIKDGSGIVCLDCFDEMAYIKKYRYGIISIIYPEWFRWRGLETEIKLPSVNTKDGGLYEQM
jgi:hypothetical protein